MLVRMWEKMEFCALLVGIKSSTELWEVVCFLKKLNKKLLYNIAILLWDIYLKELKAGFNHIFIPMFIKALFPIVKLWKQSKSLLVDE